MNPDNPTYRYSESFKKEVVARWTRGEYANLTTLLKQTGVKGHQTVKNWIALYGDKHTLPRVTRIETMKEKNELKQTQARVRELEKALSEMTMRNLLSDSFLDIACEQLGTDVENFKKKRVIEAYDARKKEAKNKGKS